VLPDAEVAASGRDRGETRIQRQQVLGRSSFLMAILAALPLVGCAHVERISSSSAAASVARPLGDPRAVISLNGDWDVEQGALDDHPPAAFGHKAPVPGVLRTAEPPFAEIGLKSSLRQAFWFRTTFRAPAEREVAILKIHKAMFGLKAWLNGVEIGSHPGSYTPAEFAVASAIRWNAENTLLVRIGAWRDSVPNWVPVGEDAERSVWIPGIYDDVELVLADAPFIVRAKIEPDLTAGAARIITTLRNTGPRAAVVRVESRVAERVRGAAVSPAMTETLSMAPNEERTVTQVAPIKSPVLWTPANPFLYVARTNVLLAGRATDNLSTRFGMRTVEFRSGPGKGFFLNGKRCFLRGSNITFHRFLDDDISGRLPWDRAWVRKLLASHPKDLHWNAFRMSLGQAPDFWYDLADEIGFLWADEFMVWSLSGPASASWSADEMATEYTEWLHENWNHPCIAWWDGANETLLPKIDEVIGRVRGLDPTRQWGNGGYTKPEGPNDPIEDHPYLFLNPHYRPPELDANDGHAPQGEHTWIDPSHPYVNDEYDWLWLNRDGAPAALSVDVYRELLGPGPHPAAEYREAFAYLVGGLTEFWRARRTCAGVLYFDYLTYSHPHGNTSDNFVDVPNLVMEPRWKEYAFNAFAPLGVYLNTWRDRYPPNAEAAIPVRVINDFGDPKTADLRVMAVGMAGDVLAASPPRTIVVPAFGVADQQFSLPMPAVEKYMLFAELRPADPSLPTVWSRRKIGFANAGEAGPAPPVK
jgi:hypothetical protein